MRALVVYCHPRSESFNAAVLSVVMQQLENADAEVRLRDLYKDGFDPSLSASELEGYLDLDTNQAVVQSEVDAVVQSEVDDLKWCDTLIFVYPTWWYGLPAMLKGWLDRTLVPGVAFIMPEEGSKDIERGLTHITRLGVFTTCGASFGLTQLMGAPGKRTLMRGLRSILATRCKTVFAAHYRMDASTVQTRAAHLDRVERNMQRFIGASTQSLQRAKG